MVTRLHFKLLVIDDDPGDVRLLRELLRDCAHRFEIQQVQTAAEAVQALQTPECDVILLDLFLPDSRGWDSFRLVQAAAPDLPIIVVSDIAEEDFTFEAVEHGAQDYLVKGEFSAPQLLRSIRFAVSRIQKESGLRESEVRYRTVFENSLDGIAIYESSLHSLRKTLVDCNDAFVAMSGRPREELMQARDIGLFQSQPASTPEKAVELHKRLLSGEAVQGMYSWLRPDGRENYVESHAVPLFMGGRILIYGIDRDVTESNMASNALREANDELEKHVAARTQELQATLQSSEDNMDKVDLILSSISAGLLVTDQEDRLQIMNPSAEDILDFIGSQARNRRLDDVIQGKDYREILLRNIVQAEVNGFSQCDFELNDTALGVPRHIRARTNPVRDREGRWAGAVTILNDVTRERVIDRMKTEFISTAAHELRTPLTSIQGFTELLLSRPEMPPEDRMEFLQMIHNSSLKLTGIISDLLDISRIESGRGFSLDKTRVDLCSVLSHCIDEFQAAGSGFEFVFDSIDPPAPAFIDSQKTQQVLQNLLSNAIKYSEHGTTVTTRLVQLEGHYRICVTDQGVGMTPEQAERIFEKFYRGHASSGEIVGTGLGMSIVKYIVEAHGGKIWVESKRGEGTTVCFTLPDRLPIKTEQEIPLSAS